MAIRITGMSSGLDTDAMVQELVSAYEKQGQKYTKAQTKVEWKQDAWKSLNTKIKSFYTKYASEMRFSENYSKKATSVSNPSVASVTASTTAVNGTQTLKVKSLAATGYMTGAEIKSEDGSKVTATTKLSELGYGEGKSTITVKSGSGSEKTFDIDGDMNVGQVANLLSKAGLNANFDSSTGRMFVSSKESGVANDFELSGGNGALDLLGLTEEKGAVKLEGADAKIELNGVDFTSSSNSFSINGLTITAKALSNSTVDSEGNVNYESTTLVTDNDVDAIYNNIKNFIKEYNSLINELDKLYNAESSGDYEPLTSEEKEVMSDDDIEKWETKIKDALLRRDSDVNSISTAMRQSMLQSYEVDGTRYSLSSFGIETLSYFLAEDNERNAFHIDGDSDDANTSSNDDKLRSMIASNPSAVQGFFTKLVGGLYDSMNNIQKVSNNYKSYGSFYSDKKLQSDYDDKAKQVSKWEDYVAEMEEKYYKQFTAMETAMTSLNDQQSSISQLLGG